MVGQSGVASASAASAGAQRYREADSIRAQRVPAKTQTFAASLPAEPSVISTIGKAFSPSPPPARLALEAPVPARPVNRSVLSSPALAKRGAAAYGAAASIDCSEAGAEPQSSAPASVNIDC